MEILDIQIEIQSHLRLHLEPLGATGCYVVLHPFATRNGDHFRVTLSKDENNQWVFSEEGNTLVEYENWERDRLTDEVLHRFLSMYDIKHKNDVFYVIVNSDNFGYYLFSLLQFLISLESILVSPA